MTTSLMAMHHEGDVVFVKTADNFIVLHDSSSSMSDKYGDTDMLEIEAERQILMEKVSTLPELDWQAGIYSFTPGWGWNDLKTHLSIRTYNKDEFSRAVEALPTKPAGNTRLKGAMAGLDEVLAGLKGKTVVFVFTDGQYSPQGGFPAPGTTAKQLAEKYDVCFQVISTEQDKAQYEAVMNIAKASECSGTLPFSQLLGHPEWMTDVLFRVEKQTKMAEKPKEKATGKIQGAVLFAFDSSAINETAAKELIELSIFLNLNKDKRVVLAGHTDSVGTEDYNMKLSQRRAESARTYLHEKMGIDKSRITLSWFGKSDPAASNDSEEGRMQNRRVTIVTADN
ncbi:MAG: OmpA family protein [Desulfocapsaceae bacterium]